jgi:penicillin-insensitive murein DD-endopeptidase
LIWLQPLPKIVLPVRCHPILPMGLLASCALLLGVVAWAPEVAHAGHDDDSVRVASRSLGWTSRGRLVGGAHVPESDLIRQPEEDKARGHFWGTAELAGLVRASATSVAHAQPGGGRLSVGELSRRGGGNIPGHRSHQNGRDVDLGFYLHDADGKPVEPTRFVNVGWHGKGVYEGERVIFDEERNWRLIENLLSQVDVPVQYIFVHWSIRRRLLATARRLGADEEVMTRAQRAILPPKGSRHPHRNHFHVRVYCDPADRPACRDRGVVWAWVPEDFAGGPHTVRAAH